MIRHRHLIADVGWSKAAIDSTLERGSLAEWRELLCAARCDESLAQSVVDVARNHPLPGVLPIVEHVLRKAWPSLALSK